MSYKQKQKTIPALALGVMMTVTPMISQAALPDVPAIVIKPETVFYESSYVGRVKAVDHVRIISKVPGEVIATHFTEGSIVEAGDLLFSLDPEPYELALESAQAALQAAEAQYKNTLLNLERSETLIASRAISEQQLLDHRAEARIRKANVAQAEAVVKQAELELRYTRIIAPFSGQTGERQVSIGDLVSDEGPLLTSIVATNPVNISFNITEADLLDRNAEYAELELTLANGEVYPHIGHIDFVDNRVAASSSNIMVRATFPNPDNTLVPGLFTRIRATDTYVRDKT